MSEEEEYQELDMGVIEGAGKEKDEVHQPLLFCLGYFQCLMVYLLAGLLNSHAETVEADTAPFAAPGAFSWREDSILVR